MTSSVCVIMARGGSKRIPRKNVKLIGGKPAVAWPVEAALRSRLFDSVIISTDDKEIADAAVSYGASQPFVRPPELANDYALTMEVLRHAVTATPGDFDFCCCLYGTSVFVTPELLVRGREALTNSKAEATLAAVPFEHPIQRGFAVSADGRAEFVSKDDFPKRTQDLKPYYHDVGLFYWFSVAALLDAARISLADFVSAPVILPRGTVVDIDTESDWLEAEKLIGGSNG